MIYSTYFEFTGFTAGFYDETFYNGFVEFVSSS